MPLLRNWRKKPVTKNSEKRVPALRFKGFTNDWEQRKLGTAIKIIKDKNKNQHSYRAFSISNIKGFIAQDEQFGKDNTYSKTDKSTNYIVKPGMFAYNPARINVGSIAYQNQIEPVLVSSLYEIFQTNSKIDDSFLMNWFKTSLFNRQIKRLEEGGVRQYFFIDKMKETEIKLPSISEQNQISKLLQLVNKNLDLQQRKLESFQFTYHEIIRRLFLKKAKWQQTKLSDLVTILDKNRKPVKKEDRLFGDTPYYGANGIQDYISGFTHKGEFILIAEDGANSLTEYPIYFVKGQIWVNNHAHVLKVNKDVSPLFLALALKQINYSKYTVGSSRNKLNLKDLENIAIFIPDNNEQQKIGQFYSNYLNYLRINKKRIQYMKQFKQFLLQNMFI